MADRRDMLGQLTPELKERIIEGAPEPYGPENPVSRAVVRFITSNTYELCDHCGEKITYKPPGSRKKDEPKRTLRILATVVDEDGNWIEEKNYYPPECYLEAGEPYGQPYTMSPAEGIKAGLIESRRE